MTYVRVDDMEADEFFYRYKDEIKAIRSELGAVLHKRLADDKREPFSTNAWPTIREVGSSNFFSLYMVCRRPYRP